MQKSIKGFIGTALILVSGIVLAGCGKSTSSVKTTATIMEQADISSLDSSQITDVGALETVNNSQEGLYRLKNSNTVEPGIAKAIVKPTDGQTVYTFKLRPNLKWSNGDPLTAADFAYAWQRAVNPATKAADAYMFLPIKNAKQIENGKMSVSQLGVKAVNKTTLKVTLAQATPYFKYLVAAVPFLPLNQKVVEKYGSAYGTSAAKTVFDGPFMVQNWSTSSVKWTLKKNPKYWDKKVVKLSSVKFAVAKSPETALSQYQSGDLDNIVLAGQQAAQEKTNKGYLSYPSGETDYLAYNFRSKTMRNANIRKAISLIINRKSLTQNVLKNGAKSPYGLAPEEISKNPSNGADFAKDSSVKESVAFNPTLAKKYWAKGLKQLGVKKLNMKLVCYDVDSFKNSAEYVQANAKKYLKGANIEINAQPKVQAITTMQKKRGYDIGFTNWIASYPDLNEFFQLLNTNNVNNAGNYSNKTYDKLYSNANVKDVTNPQKRYDDFKQANQVAMKDQAITALNQGQIARLNKPGLKGITYAAAQGISLKNAYWAK
ncbi:peptide ABC transporter substrate-binding protein [Lactobacillus sp. LC28-10]|uniref:Peptide ABC transporter substrate-binding protein n=1 Tax=Secundilactobacillus angelensis TaxID=2722706 RepID=A0ABX1L036_9LACO|nr:peptide ABC transporter substrate-binding protein [Secundilactobacillus angelensis]MCH5462791.1 peptide ABC transporter substrate-binding protein [Secundilactobacillus angelensis]NLR19561.1 peptide ABC transporter substrate-binding protein [Secundilactobacillus angelensis]